MLKITLNTKPTTMDGLMLRRVYVTAPSSSSWKRYISGRKLKIQPMNILFVQMQHYFICCLLYQQLWILVKFQRLTNKASWKWKIGNSPSFLRSYIREFYSLKYPLTSILFPGKSCKTLRDDLLATLPFVYRLHSFHL